MMLLWLFIKSAFSRAIDLFTRYPLQIILVLACCYGFWQQKQRYAITYEFEAYKQGIKYQTDMQKAKNEILRRQADKAATEIVAIHTKEIEAVKHEYEKRNKLANIAISDLRNRLRSKVSDSISLPVIDTNSERTAEEWRDSYTAISGQYQTLIEACTITTLDYNALRGWADAACNQVGCD